MWRTLRNRHLVQRLNRPRDVVALMLFTALSALTFIWADFPLWRVAVVVVVSLSMSALETLLLRGDPSLVDFDRRQTRHIFIVLPLVMLLITMTGGLRGPLAPFVFIVALVPLVLLGYTRAVRIHHAVCVTLIAVVGFLPDSVLGPPLPKEQHAVITAMLAAMGLVVISMRVRDLVRAAQAGIDELDRMREERLAEASERLGRMQLVSSRIAHELKNPLAAAKSLVQLTMKSATAKDQERLGVVHDELTRVEVILRDYLSFSRPLDDLKLTSVDVAEVLVDVREVLSGRAETAGVTLTSATTMTLVQADPRRLKEALINLLANAIEATPAGGSVALGCAPTASGATLTLNDSGRGMSPEELAKVGVPFFSKRDGGTGLGVHLARGVVAQHGGTIRYESEPGRGTTVTIQLPIRPPLGAPLATLTPNPASPA